jgi:hypothetical protein
MPVLHRGHNQIHSPGFVGIDWDQDSTCLMVWVVRYYRGRRLNIELVPACCTHDQVQSHQRQTEMWTSVKARFCSTSCWNVEKEYWNKETVRLNLYAVTGKIHKQELKNQIGKLQMLCLWEQFHCIVHDNNQPEMMTSEQKVNSRLHLRWYSSIELCDVVKCHSNCLVHKKCMCCRHKNNP